MGQEVPAQTTKISASVGCQAILNDLTRILGKTPKRALVAMLLAHIWVETDGGSLKNNCPGKLMAAGFVKDDENGGMKEVFVWDDNFWRPPWFKDEKHPNHALMMEGLEPSALRAYSKLPDGISDYLRLLVSAHFQTVLLAAATGNTMAFATALKTTNYTPRLDINQCTKELDGYLSAFNAQKLFDGIPNGAPGSPPPNPTPIVLSRKDVLLPKNSATLFRLQKGTQGALVMLWQTLLNGELNLALAVNGTFDDDTIKASAEWQKKMGFTGSDINGVVDAETWGRFMS